MRRCLLHFPPEGPNLIFLGTRDAFGDPDSLPRSSACHSQCVLSQLAIGNEQMYDEPMRSDALPSCSSTQAWRKLKAEVG
jgi:hypothetical protein